MHMTTIKYMYRRNMCSFFLPQHELPESLLETADVIPLALKRPDDSKFLIEIDAWIESKVVV